MMTLAYIGIEATAVDDWADFATVVGFDVEHDGGNVLLRQDERAYRFVILPAQRDDIAFLGLECGDRSDWECRIGELSEAGIAVAIASGPECRERRVGGLARLTDSDGLSIELVHGLATADRPFQSAHLRSGFETQGIGFGHALVKTRSCETSRAFYERFLGARLSDHIELRSPTPGRIAFLHFNARHHSLALIESGAVSTRRLQHVMVQLQDLTELGQAYDRIAASRFALTATLGQHPNDRSLSFYCATPSKLWMEIGWSSRRIDSDDWQPRVYATTSLWGHKVIHPS
jgi:2,3-dihydroxybiphenyl 1,2-dioxygenase